MKKYIIGFIAGISITLSFSVSADSLIGKAINAIIPVHLEGEDIGRAIVIDGISYLPLRDISENLYLNINYDPSLKIINLRKIEIVRNDEKENNMDVEGIIMNNATILSKKLNRENNEHKFDYLIVDENFYVVASFFSSFATWDSKLQIFTIALPNEEPILFLANKEYSKDIDSFIHHGRIFIKLSALGLKAEIIDDVLWIKELD